VRFYVLETSDFDPLFPVRRALWTATDGFQIESTTLFELDAVGGFSVFWNTSMEQWLVAWVDSTGAIRLSTLTEDGALLASPPSFVYQIPNWNHPWKGYLAVHIDGADTNGGRTLLLLYSRMINTFSSDMPVVRVTIAGP
jgi:hypothetical protein